MKTPAERATEYARIAELAEKAAHAADDAAEAAREAAAACRKLEDGHLIAAAPELLAALEALLMAVRCNAEGGRPRTADEIFAMAGSAAQFAIAKATGGASR